MHRMTDRLVVAHVRGNHEVYEVKSEVGRWKCSCPAGKFGSLCSHVAAVGIITEPGSAAS